jgi:hypothetical protein
MKSDPTFAAAVGRVQPVLAAWRRRRKHREPVPEALWRAMVTLARDYGLNPVAHALNVNYAALQRHLAPCPTPKASAVGAKAPGFVEVPVAAWPGVPQCVIELEDRRGSKLTVRLAQSESLAALALAQGLWRHRR